MVLNDPTYLEHDAYFLFEKFMEKMWDWYAVTPSPPPPTSSRSRTTSPLSERQPFERSHDLHLCPAAKRLQILWEETLRSHDRELFDHLQEMCIIPTTFGTNWTKLLFSRQFADYLIVWDAVIATNFTVVEHVVVAMVRDH